MSISKYKIGFIISNAFLFSNKAKKLRNAIINDIPIVKIVNFEKFLVFKAGITTAITFFDKTKNYSSTDVLTISKKELSVPNIIRLINDDNLFFNTKFELNKEFALINEDMKEFNAKMMVIIKN